MVSREFCACGFLIRPEAIAILKAILNTNLLENVNWFKESLVLAVCAVLYASWRMAQQWLLINTEVNTSPSQRIRQCSEED